MKRAMTKKEREEAIKRLRSTYIERSSSCGTIIAILAGLLGFVLLCLLCVGAVSYYRHWRSPYYCELAAPMPGTMQKILLWVRGEKVCTGCPENGNC